MIGRSFVQYPMIRKRFAEYSMIGKRFAQYSMIGRRFAQYSMICALRLRPRGSWKANSITWGGFINQIGG